MNSHGSHDQYCHGNHYQNPAHHVCHTRPIAPECYRQKGYQLQQDRIHTHIPEQAMRGPIARARAPRDRNIPVILPFSSPSPNKFLYHTSNTYTHTYITHTIVLCVMYVCVRVSCVCAWRQYIVHTHVSHTHSNIYCNSRFHCMFLPNFEATVVKADTTVPAPV